MKTAYREDIEEVIQNDKRNAENTVESILKCISKHQEVLEALKGDPCRFESEVWHLIVDLKDEVDKLTNTNCHICELKRFIENGGKQ